ncbi:hypothetical protein PUNSTDRAFT_61819, partial [Punctularia strigosozonata HHB-11173 SS5]|uniref:uncharacterized protein n=1 Tax=Punctularia strigosozonata (strain HHB-11173) TaxID=741275 RepID=UPI0004417C3C
QAVLLLRPNVALYSTDALPINCSAYHPSPSTPSSSSSHGRPAAPTKEAAPMPRTCDCLTQTLYCHGCGTGVGYMIVVPCARCTQSIGANNRATNGHRFVFHSSEISVCERHYIADEPGVHPAYTPQPAQSSPNPSLASMATSPMMHAPPSPVHMIVPSHREPRHRSSRSHPPVRAPQDGDEEDEEEDYDDMVPSDAEVERVERLMDGDVLYWHQLVRSGEIPGVVEDERARKPKVENRRTAKAWVDR